MTVKLLTPLGVCEAYPDTVGWKVKRKKFIGLILKFKDGVWRVPENRVPDYNFEETLEPITNMSATAEAIEAHNEMVKLSKELHMEVVKKRRANNNW